VNKSGLALGASSFCPANLSPLIPTPDELLMNSSNYRSSFATT
jgi:hypothetical protein